MSGQIMVRSNGYSGPESLSDSSPLVGAARGVDAVFS